ncbi:hypothetical protein PZH31_19180, partial [[Ruminococcus] torques]|nr:hypothetical protein [[Ruminococcus] torques]
GFYQHFAEQAKTLGLDLVAAEAFTADSKTDFSVQLQKAKDAGAELVFLPIYYQEASLILAHGRKPQCHTRRTGDFIPICRLGRSC